MSIKLLDKFKDTPITFGGASISGEGGGYGFGDISEDESINLVKEALDLGIKIFDAAPIYGFRTCEQRLGLAFKQDREKAFIVSKCGVHWHANKRVDIDNSKKTTTKMLETSLKDLQSDYIDLYMVHWPDERVDIRETIEVLAKAKMDGKIKHIGLSNTYVDHLKLAQEVEEIEVVQGPYSLFQKNLEEELFRYLDECNISFMSFGTFEKGILTGKVTKEREFDKSDCRSWAPWWKQDKSRFAKMDAMVKISKYLEEVGHSEVELALAHNLAHSTVSTAICGMRKSSYIHSTLKALKNLPSNEVILKCVSIYDEYK